jgi:putative DNA primase/helicase
LSGRTDLHKIMLLIGPTRSGKGTIARILTALIGAANPAGPTLASLGTNFGLSPLLGKPLAVVSDARLGSGNEHQVVERLLSISGEDMLTVDRKYREPWTGKLPTRFLVLSNELPRFGDASGAIPNRFIVLVMTESVLGKQNIHLTAELMTELPGILGSSLDGLDRLARAGTLTSPNRPPMQSLRRMIWCRRSRRSSGTDAWLTKWPTFRCRTCSPRGRTGRKVTGSAWAVPPLWAATCAPWSQGYA